MGADFKVNDLLVAAGMTWDCEPTMHYFGTVPRYDGDVAFVMNCIYNGKRHQLFAYVTHVAWESDEGEAARYAHQQLTAKADRLLRKLTA